MANPTIGATTPRIQYTATASQTVFTVPFEFLANADLAVYVNGTLKTLTTDYTLTGANTTGGGSLTFVTDRTAGEIVTILGNLAYSRDTNKYTKYGLLPAEVLEADFDAMQVQAKQLARDGQFALRAPLTDTGTPDMVLPAKATRATKVLGFDSDGDPVASASSVADIDATVQIIDTLNALPAGASSSISYQPAGTGAVTTTVQAKLRETVSVKDFGAVGDGTTDDTVAIQAALNSGAKVVQCVQGSTYLVAYAGTFTVNSISQRYCLTVPTGVTFDLQKATIKQSNSQNASIIVLNGTTDSAVVNGVLDSNKANQTTPATGEMASVFVHNSTRPTVEKIRAINNRQYAGRFLKNTGGRYVDLWCTDSDADGWSFGIDGGWSAQIVEAFIDNIYAESCTQVYGGGFQGNPAIFTTHRCLVGKVVGKNCAGGIKIQDSSEDSSFDSLTFIGQTNGTANSGIKVQGNGAGLQPKRIRVNSANSKSAYGNGLYVSDAVSVEIGKYHGLSNGTGAGATGSTQYDFDINIPTGGRLIVGAVDIDSPGTIGCRIQGAGTVKFDTVHVRNPTGVACQYSGSGEFYATDIRAIDSGAAMTQVLKITSGSKGRIKNVTTDVSHSTSNSRVVIQNLLNFEIDTILLGSSDTLNGVVQLTNAATSTAVTCGHCWREYVGGASTYFHPVISIIPFNSSAATLGNMRTTVTDGSSGTGFSINHAAAGASDYVFFKVIGWKCATRASS